MIQVILGVKHKLDPVGRQLACIYIMPFDACLAHRHFTCVPKDPAICKVLPYTCIGPRNVMVSN
jgi:hypothetical protein